MVLNIIFTHIIGYNIIDTNSEVAENAVIVIQCPKNPEPRNIVWKITRMPGGDLEETICSRAPEADDCTEGVQSSYYKNRVTKVNSNSIKVSTVFLNETGTYHCSNGLDDYLTYTNVRIISKCGNILSLMN